MNELLGVALRVTVMYFYVLAMLRISGKRSIGNLSPLDFAVAAIIGDMFDDVFWAEIPVSQGLVGVGTIILLHMLMSLGQSRIPAFQRVVDGRPVAVLRSGKLVKQGMAQERTGENKVWSEVRSAGIEEEKAGEVREAAWDINGKMAVLRHRWAEPIQKGDLPELRKLLPGTAERSEGREP